MPIFHTCRDCQRIGTKSNCPCGGAAYRSSIYPQENTSQYFSNDVLIANHLWNESASRRGYWRDFNDVGRAVLYRTHKGWQFTFRGSRGVVVTKSGKAFYSSAEEAAQEMLKQLANEPLP